MNFLFYGLVLEMLENSKYAVDFCGDENFFVIISQLNQLIENQKEQNIARSNPKL